MNGYLFTVCADGAERAEYTDPGEACALAVERKAQFPEEVITVLVNLAQVRLDLDPADVGRIADALDTLAGLDEGEHTDYYELLRLRDLVRGQAVLR